MGLIMIIGPQAVGKMTVGKALEERIDGKLLYNHQTIDLFAEFLGYTAETFKLSDQIRLELFEAFAKHKETNQTETIIFTVMIDFDSNEDWRFLKKVNHIFRKAGENVAVIELESDLEIRLVRNIHPERLAAKPSKRNLQESREGLLRSHENRRLNSDGSELPKKLKDIQYLKIDNSYLEPEEVAEMILNKLKERED